MLAHHGLVKIPVGFPWLPSKVAAAAHAGPGPMAHASAVGRSGSRAAGPAGASGRRVRAYGQPERGRRRRAGELRALAARRRPTGALLARPARHGPASALRARPARHGPAGALRARRGRRGMGPDGGSCGAASRPAGRRPGAGCGRWWCRLAETAVGGGRLRANGMRRSRPAVLPSLSPFFFFFFSIFAE